MKCKHCNGTGQEKIYDTLTNAYLLIKCAYCNGSGELPQTNEEWFAGLTTEEKAEWITDKINAKLRMALHDAELYDGDVNENEYMENEDEWVEWLKQPHSEVGK